MSGHANAFVLIVADSADSAKELSAILARHGFDVASASDGLEGLERAKKLRPALVLLSLSASNPDGFETCRLLKKDSATRDIPVGMVLPPSDGESKDKALEAGANDFLAIPVDGAELVARAKNMLNVKRRLDLLETRGKEFEAKTSEWTRHLQDALIDTVQRLTLTAEYRDEDSYTHVKRTRFYTELIAAELGLPRQEADIMCFASPMHDIGKVGIPDSILLKPGTLTPQEMEVMKTHTTIGGRILRGSASPFLQSAEKFALHHHERWDGTGYPQGLKEEEIPIEGRIMYLIDQYDALRSRRPYKAPFRHETVVSIILKGDYRTSPGHFDPVILDIFRASEKKFEEIFETHQDL